MSEVTFALGILAGYLLGILIAPTHDIGDIAAMVKLKLKGGC